MRRYIQLSVSVTITFAALFFALREVEVDRLTGGLSAFDPIWCGVLFVVLTLNLLLVSLRLNCLMAAFGASGRLLVALRANIAGALAGFVVFQMLGSLLGRHHVLKQSGVPVELTTSVTYYEKIGVFLFSGTLCVFGGLILDGGAILSDATKSIPILEMVIGLASCVAMFIFWARSKFEKDLIRSFGSVQFLRGVAELTTLSVAALFFNYLAFVSALWTFGADGDLLQLLAAAAIVSFVASLPISANGWGVREVAAIQVFGVLGVPAETALLVSLLVGVSSIAVIGLGALVFPMPEGVRAKNQDQYRLEVRDRGTPVELERVLAWMLAHGVCILLFFQVQVPVRDSLITLNLADPLALLSLFALGLSMWSRRQAALFRMPHTGLFLIGVTVVIVLAFVNGALQFGVTPWALTNRLLGWVVVLGYVATGVYVVTTSGWMGLRRIAESLLVTAAVIVAVHLAFIVLNSLGASFQVPSNFDGFSGNRNALAFLLLVAASGGLAISKHWRSVGKGTILALLLGIILMGLWYSKGRTALVSGAILVAVAYVLALCDRRSVLQAVVLAVIGSVTIPYIPSVIHELVLLVSGEPLDGVRTFLFAPPIVQSGDSERMLSIIQGFELWLSKPVFGAGLGAFVRLSLGEHGQMLVIHSTPLWLLTELGIVGAFVVLGFFLRAGLYTLRNRYLPRQTADRFLFLLLLVYGMFFLPHDIFYQRGFWFALGLTLAAPMILRKGEGRRS